MTYVWGMSLVDRITVDKVAFFLRLHPPAQTRIFAGSCRPGPSRLSTAGPSIGRSGKPSSPPCRAHANGWGTSMSAPLTHGCLRCSGTGRVQWKHIQAGICFACEGSGKVTEAQCKRQIVIAFRGGQP